MTLGIPESSARSGSRRVALATIVAFGCATVRVPASTMAETVPVHGRFAEPQIELWLESGRPVTAAESAEASGQVRAALESALTRVAAPEGDAILVVRAQGLARTPSRRTDQRAATAGLVIGAVVVVAAVVVVLVATHGKGGGGGAGRSAPSAAAVRHLPRSGRSVPGAPRFGVAVLAGSDVQVSGGGQTEEDTWTEPPQGWDSQRPAPAWAPSAQLASVSLPPAPALDLRGRGFFEGDTLRLELIVVDCRDGTPLWTKTVEGEIDPRDARAVEQLLGGAVADGGGWIPAYANDTAP